MLPLMEVPIKLKNSKNYMGKKFKIGKNGNN